MASSTHYAIAVAGLGLLYLAYLSLYRLFFCPIAYFPGPKLAALTFWYEFYYDVIQRGQYEFKIAKLHEEYGPIIRINPYELHIVDPEFLETLYLKANPSDRIDKWQWQSTQFGSPQSIFGTHENGLHRHRRGAAAPLFSTQAIHSLEPVIQKHVDHLRQRLIALKGTGEVVNIIDCFSCLTGDVISDYCFGRPSGYLESPDWTPQWHALILDYSDLAHSIKQFPWLLWALDSMPERLAEFMNPPLAEVNKLIRLIKRQIGEAELQSSSRGLDDAKGQAHENVFKYILESDELPKEEKSLTRLVQDGLVFMNAGTVTTADVLSLTTFELLENPSIAHRLRAELAAASEARKSTGPMKLQQLEQLPYLSAVIKEGLRAGHGVVQRQARIRPDAELVFQGMVIPRGTPVSMSPWNVHLDPEVFPDPETFKPERWLLDDGKTLHKALDKYIMSFGKGTRICLGRSLALAELYMTMAALHSPQNHSGASSNDKGVDFSLFETTREDVRFVREAMMPAPYIGSKGIRVTVQ